MTEHTKTASIVAALAVCVLAACGASDDGGSLEIETVDVAPGRTSVLTTAYDEVAPQRQESFTGVLPAGFPGDLPLYSPSNLTDFGTTDSGRYVLLFSPDETTMVRQRLTVELRRTGWTLIDGGIGRGTYRRGSRSVVLSVLEARPGTEIRIEY